MKKFTLFAAAAVVALSASAQYNVTDPTTKAVAEKYPGATIDYIVLDEAVATALGNQGFKLNYVGPNGEDVNLWLWDGTLTGAVSTEKGVDGEEAYLCVDQTNLGWAGGGYCVSDDSPKNYSHMTDETVLHIAYRCGNGTIAGMYFTPFDNHTGNDICLGGSFDGCPKVGNAPTEDWQAIEISLGEMKKICTSWKANLASFTGNLLAFGGDIQQGYANGANLCLDAVYFITPGGGNAIETIESADNAAAVYYNLQGVRVLNPENGVFVRVAGKQASKVVL